MKIKAHAKCSEGNLILNSHTGRPEVHYVWDVLDKRDNFPLEFKKENLTYVSIFDSKVEMTARLPGSFAYKSKATSAGVTNKDSELVSHEMFIQVLEELGVVNFKIGNKIYPFEFEEISSNNLKVQFGEGRYYYPDLVGRFKARDDNPYHEKWGGKVAIEVTVTHQCEKVKLVEFKDHNIAILEVKVRDSMRFYREGKGQSRSRKLTYTSKDLKSYYDYLHKKLSSEVFASILSDPISIGHHKSLMSNLRLNYKKLNDDCKKLKTSYDELREENGCLVNRHNSKLELTKKDKEALQTKVRELEGQLIYLKEKNKNKALDARKAGAETEQINVKAMGFWELISFWRAK